jgi:plasmid maintenance system antidote protein VapI
MDNLEDDVALIKTCLKSGDILFLVTEGWTWEAIAEHLGVTVELIKDVRAGKYEESKDVAVIR